MCVCVCVCVRVSLCHVTEHRFFKKCGWGADSSFIKNKKKNNLDKPKKNQCVCVCIIPILTTCTRLHTCDLLHFQNSLLAPV